MKYISLHLLILTGATLSLTGCFRNFDYDLSREHDIYRMDYKYKRPAESVTESTPPAESKSRVITPAAPQQSAPAPLPNAGIPPVPTTPAVPATPPPAAAPGASNGNNDTVPHMVSNSGGGGMHPVLVLKSAPVKSAANQPKKLIKPATSKPKMTPAAATNKPKINNSAAKKTASK